MGKKGNNQKGNSGCPVPLVIKEQVFVLFSSNEGKIIIYSLSFWGRFSFSHEMIDLCLLVGRNHDH